MNVNCTWIYSSLVSLSKLISKLDCSRLQEGQRGNSWMTYSVLSTEPVTAELQLAAVNCIDGPHSMRFASRALIGKVTVWTAEYQRPTRKSSRHFAMVDCETGQLNFIEIKKLSVCCKCNQMWASAWALCATAVYKMASQYTVLKTEWVVKVLVITPTVIMLTS